MSKETAAAILTQIYFQTSEEARAALQKKEKGDSFPTPGGARNLGHAQQQIANAYEEFLNQLSQ
jgi:hypothetical protein